MRGSKITLNTIKKLPVSQPSVTKVVLWDTEIKGFGAYRTSDNSISLIYQYAMPGGMTKSTMFAKLGEVTLEQGRHMAADMAYDRRCGIDPIDKRKSQIEAVAVSEDLLVRNYAVAYIDRRIAQMKPFKKAEAAIITRDIVGLLGDQRIDKLTVSKVEAFADKLAERAPSARRMGLVYLNVVLNDAVRREVIEKNVANKVTVNKAGERDRRLREDELQRFLEAAADMGDCRGDIYELLVRTLKRKEEISRMQWGHLNIAKREWSLSAEMTKGRVSHIIELPTQCMAIILRQQPDPRLRVGPVFSMNGGKTWPEMGSQVKDLLDAHIHQRLELANERDGTAYQMAHFTVHDLRTTGASRLQEKPFQMNTALIDAILLHKDANAVTRTYQRAMLEIESGEALQRWNDYIDELMSAETAFPGGRQRMPIDSNEERTRRFKLLRTGWPMRADQKRAAENRAQQ